MTAPLVITAHLDDDTFAILDGMRRRHFPPALNKVPAHISLFHHLPGEELATVRATVAQSCRDTRSHDLEPLEARFLGRGVALAYRSPELSRLHGELARQWRDWLTPQDRQPFKAHVTIQNKVEPAVARALHASLAGVPPPSCRIDGITIWRYLDGPWERVKTCSFAA